MSQINKIVCIIAMWSLLAFVGYNVLTVEAASEKETGECRSVTEPDDEFYCDDFDWEPYTPDRENVEKMCDASEDYAKNPKNCDKAYNLVEKAEEKAADEDAICDNEDADTTNVKLCMSEDRKQKKNEKEREWYYNENTGSYEYLSDKEIKDHNLESESGIKQGKKWGPETPIEPPSEPYPTEIEDWSNTVSDTNYEQGQKEKYEQLAKQYTEEEQEEMTNAIKEAASKSNDDESNESESQEEVSEQEEEEGEEEESSEEDNSSEESESEE